MHIALFQMFMLVSRLLAYALDGYNHRFDANILKIGMIMVSNRLLQSGKKSVRQIKYPRTYGLAYLEQRSSSHQLMVRHEPSVETYSWFDQSSSYLHLADCTSEPVGKQIDYDHHLMSRAGEQGRN